MARFDATRAPIKPSRTELRELRREFDETKKRLREAGIIDEDGAITRESAGRD